MNAKEAIEKIEQYIDHVDHDPSCELTIECELALDWLKGQCIKEHHMFTPSDLELNILIIALSVIT